MKIESRVGKIQADQNKIYELLADFTNLGKYVPNDKVQDFTSDVDSCSFTVDKIGNVGMKIIEREPIKTIKIENGEGTPFKFNMWIQLKEVGELDVRIKITIKADLNPMMKMMAKKPLKTFVNTLVDRLEQIR